VLKYLFRDLRNLETLHNLQCILEVLCESDVIAIPMKPDRPEISNTPNTLPAEFQFISI
jgi:hypothetical protein